MKKNIFMSILFFMGLFGFFSCILDENANENKGFIFDEKTFNSEWNNWNNKNILNYSFTMTGKLQHEYFQRALLMQEYRVNITVKNGSMDSFVYIGDIPYEGYYGDDGNWESKILEPEFTSIADMYQKISNRAKEEREWWEENSDSEGFISTTFNVKYDSQLHYITFFEPVIKTPPDWSLDTTAHAVTISNFMLLDSK